MFGFGNKKRIRELEERLARVCRELRGFIEMRCGTDEAVKSILERLGYTYMKSALVFCYESDEFKATHTLVDAAFDHKIWKKKDAQ